MGSNKEFSRRKGIGKAGGDKKKPVVARRREGLSRKKKSVVRHLEQQELFKETLIKRGGVLNCELANNSRIED